VVVDAAETAKLLLDKTKNCLKKRVTLLPLDKMETRGLLGKAQLDEARRLVGREKVFLAKELVQCEPYLEPIMDFVFGSVLVYAFLGDFCQ
jgi:chromosome segregation ATPase